MPGAADAFDGSHTAPMLPAPDPDALSQWYSDHLGFPRRVSHGDYAIVRRGDLALHFWACRERKIAENTSFYCELRDGPALDRLFDELTAAASRPGFHPGRMTPDIMKTDYGMREVHVWDPAGNLLRFGAADPGDT